LILFQPDAALFSNLTIALTADLHWGAHSEDGDVCTRRLVADLMEHPPDVLILGGDIGAGEDFERCLELFAPLSCRKALVPGNHDVWVREEDARGDSWTVYTEYLPKVSAKHGFQYLDHLPLLLPDTGLAIVGSMNWYDYSWSIDELPKYDEQWEERLRRKMFTRGIHNDSRFVRWQHTDASFTAQVVKEFERQLEEALQQVPKAIVVTHHPAFEGLNPPPIRPPHLDQLLWKAFSGNGSMEQVLQKHAKQIPFVFSSHTHRARDNSFHGIPGHNIGGDYTWKRLLRLEWPSGNITAREFRLE
jgi:3',5'-cyclic AMP phosphodiesterase CpdA